MHAIKKNNEHTLIIPNIGRILKNLWLLTFLLKSLDAYDGGSRIMITLLKYTSGIPGNERSAARRSLSCEATMYFFAFDLTDSLLEVY